jgi:hypothetical protein
LASSKMVPWLLMAGKVAGAEMLCYRPSDFWSDF